MFNLRWLYHLPHWLFVSSYIRMLLYKTHNNVCFNWRINLCHGRYQVLNVLHIFTMTASYLFRCYLTTDSIQYCRLLATHCTAAVGSLQLLSPLLPIINRATYWTKVRSSAASTLRARNAEIVSKSTSIWPILSTPFLPCFCFPRLFITAAIAAMRCCCKQTVLL